MKDSVGNTSHFSEEKKKMNTKLPKSLVALKGGPNIKEGPRRGVRVSITHKKTSILCTTLCGRNNSIEKM